MRLRNGDEANLGKAHPLTSAPIYILPENLNLQKSVFNKKTFNQFSTKTKSKPMWEFERFSFTFHFKFSLKRVKLGLRRYLWKFTSFTDDLKIKEIQRWNSEGRTMKLSSWSNFLISKSYWMQCSSKQRQNCSLTAFKSQATQFSSDSNGISSTF